jgi:VWFA-related protein
MRRLIILGLAALTALPAGAAHKITIAQLEQTLSADANKHRGDADIARQLAELQLSERLTVPTQNRLISSYALQPHAALALELLSDESALLDPPRNELPPTAPPDPASQQHILAASNAYVLETIPRLPNFFATRSTVRFDDSAQVLHEGEWPIRAGFHLVGNNARTVTMRDGQEVTDSPQQISASAEQVMGLYSFGEFGPILARTLADLSKGKIQFSHWEESPLGVAAVFHYSVPKRESHYHVHFCCLASQEFQGGGSYRNRSLPRYHSGDQNPVETNVGNPYDATPPYHGTVAIDPASGAIVRLTLDAELDPDNAITRASTVVEYGRVTIGDHTFVCPVRSLAISAQQGPPPTGQEVQRVPVLSINETTFTQYHRLGSSARLIASGALSGADAPGPVESSPEPPAETSGSAAPKAVAETAAPAPPAATAPVSVDPAPPSATPPASSQPAAAVTDSARPSNTPAPPEPEISMSEPGPLPDTPAASLGTNNYAEKATPRLVRVRLIAFDKKGHPVTDLKADDFELLDDGKKQEILLSPPADAPAASRAEALASRTFRNRVADASGTQPANGRVSSAGTILLIDESHVASDDLAWARSQILKFLSALPPDERVGIYTMTGAEFQPLLELTSDRSDAAGKIGSLLAAAQADAKTREAERRDQKPSTTARNGPPDQSNHDGAASDANSPAAPFIALDQVARHLASIPGHKNLAWFLSEREPASNGKKENPGPDPRLFQALSLHSQESMNEADISVFPVNLAQTSAGPTADLASSSLDLAAAAAATANAAASAGAAGGSGSVRQSRQGSGITQMQSQDGLDSRGVQGAIRQLAEGTGGHAIPRSDDLDDALNGIVREDRSAYQLRFVPQGAPDGRFHPITIGLTSRKGITVRSRTGYLSEQEPPTLKERFQAAVWRPNDATGIALSAAIADAPSSGNTVHLSIAASDLGMEQQTGRWMDKVDVFLIQRDDAGKHSHVDSQALVMNLKPETYQKSMSAGIPFDHSLELQPGMSSVRIVVVDNNSGRIGSVTIPSSALRPGGQAEVHTPQARTP